MGFDNRTALLILVIAIFSFGCLAQNPPGAGNATAGGNVGNYSGPATTPPPVNVTPPITGNVTNVTQTGNVTNFTQTGANATTGNATTANVSTGNGTTGTPPIQVVCGDGKISSPGEDCDGGNVATNVCQPGYSCKLCKCVPSSSLAQCGDGTITPPEECDSGNTYTNLCPEGKICSSCLCADEVVPPIQPYCGNDIREGNEQCDGTDAALCTSDQYCSSCMCVQKSAICGNDIREGNEQCDGTDATACTPDQYCSNCLCVQRGAVCGNGRVESGEQCEKDSNCKSGYHCSNCMCVQNQTYCGDGQKNGNEECDPTATPSGCIEGSVCSSGCLCVSPPALNCGQICSYTPGAQSFGGGYRTQTECTNVVKSQFSTKTCFLTCTYAYLYTVTNVAGSASCCCGMTKEFACSNCPCQGTTCDTGCPGEQTCQQNAPGWYQP